MFIHVQTEKQSLRAQNESLQREHTISDEENSRLVLRAHELEKDNAALRGRAEEAIHRGKLDVSNVKVEMLRDRGDIERERDKLHSELQGIWITSVVQQILFKDATLFFTITLAFLSQFL